VFFIKSFVYGHIADLSVVAKTAPKDVAYVQASMNKMNKLKQTIQKECKHLKQLLDVDNEHVRIRKLEVC